MRRLLMAAAVAIMILGAAPAQALVMPGFRVGVDIAGTVPFLEWAEDSGFGVGALASAAYTALPVIHFTARVGFIQGFQRGPKSIAHIPLLLGVKVYPAQSLGLYAALEAGPVWNQRTVSSEGQGFETNWGATGGIGFTFGPVDGRVAVFLPDLVHGDKMLGLLTTLGYYW
ncbi:MAG: hypothetical protein ABIK09_08260 [Pseudomonadota bacterium]